ncbi:hypothetical protein F4703DRAFT_1056669 [Phycomyces blakesleeanus]|uniref:Uncharacterized protein n=1 Tax=Phycomyces blakesleeanus (strain ATCC 8743b / DSM 1359 / FGSC 10004 / NBRC 33097 / NRRL 1555) TaxID=763407 RepID=A0A162YE12_PHYB8|nr:hypothetical protein PHYBLDRAFT_59195 [Phycomyces blakesleeanus NRRL 1555(-)]OAD80155.1 hypothetical protein PHYBLDRAFT_59195 [Phycomyces blakesleeanus NRRL 1555(-)]|eukprot:XP_018298195.1 hypothetical protein PHYBLDRAFT_59195 [Phycomyces blakesleeanus NRRL 1555(-)]
MAINLLESLPRVSGVSEKLQTKLARLTRWPTRRQHSPHQKHGTHNSVTAKAAANEKYLRRSPSRTSYYNYYHYCQNSNENNNSNKPENCSRISNSSGGSGGSGTSTKNRNIRNEKGNNMNLNVSDVYFHNGCQTICSEDLTASQFADITGIRIHQSGRCPEFSPSDQKIYLATQDPSQEDSTHAPRFGPTRSRNLSIWDSDFWNQKQHKHKEHQENHQHHNHHNHHNHKQHYQEHKPEHKQKHKQKHHQSQNNKDSDSGSDQQRLKLQDKCHVESKPHYHHHSNTSCQSHQSLNQLNPNSGISLQRTISSGGQTTYSSIRSSNYTLPVDETPFISSLRLQSNYERRPSVVQKGRFKIELEIGNGNENGTTNGNGNGDGDGLDNPAATTTAISTSDNDSMASLATTECNVVEWKRKRACTS